ncbi:helix-turn-helix transcriptional regulator [Paenibacillus sp. FSL H7-0716]|uniref:Transcriptional regulator n=1 Tax=Paenibacillus odorifer TaxID=189426 RepID=A0AB36J5M6_9BACL|nr:helix-turn-helix transcriptional regulator [Paenibacillus odorifer]OME09502.1 transcriptional regulator [Paenibacillus odorifer]
MKKVDLEKIKVLRKNAGLSLEEMAVQLGYESANGYYYLEIGRGKFPAETLAKVAQIFGVTIEELFFEEKITDSVILGEEREVI